MRTIARSLTAALFVLALARPVAAQPSFITIQPSQVSGITATTVTRNQVTLGQQSYNSAEMLLNVTAGGTATGTMQIWIEDSVDGGTTFDDLCSSLTFALGAAVTTQRFFITAYGTAPATITTAALTNLTQGSAAAVETMAAGSCRQGPIGSVLRVREKITGPSGSPVGATYTITAVFR
jgi:hypothetical protein